MNDLDWAWRKARQMADEFHQSGPARRTKPHDLGRFQKVIVETAVQMIRGLTPPPIRHAEDD